MKQFEVSAEKRTDLGKGASRRLRRAGKVPAVVYGEEQDAVALTLLHSEMVKHLENEAFYSHVLTLNTDGSTEQVVLKDLQRHPHKPVITHADFQRISAGHKLHMHVPLHFLNEEACVGVKTGGGTISHLMVEVEVVCLPKDLPEYIEVDVIGLNIGETIHLSDLKPGDGVNLAALEHGSDLPVVSVSKLRGTKGDEAEDAAAEAKESE